MSKQIKISIGLAVAVLIVGALILNNNGKLQKGSFYLPQFTISVNEEVEDDFVTSKKPASKEKAPRPPQPAPAPRPDLWINRVDIPSEIRVGETLRLNVFVQNSGTAGSGSTALSAHPFIVNGSAQPRFFGTVNALLPNLAQIGTVIIPVYSFAAGDVVTFNVCVDPNGAIPELDESNNCFDTASSNSWPRPASTRILP